MGKREKEGAADLFVSQGRGGGAFANFVGFRPDTVYVLCLKIGNILYGLELGVFDGFLSARHR